MIPRALLLFVPLILLGPDALGAAPAPGGLGQRIWDITDAVLDRHLEPPTRPQMILEGLMGLYRGCGATVPAGLARRVSSITTPQDLAPLLDETWARVTRDATAEPGRSIEPERLLIEALVDSLPGGARLLSPREVKAEEQLAGNRYVGIHVALGMNQEEERASIATAFEGGPADRAGVKKGDLIEEINGVSTANLRLTEVVERLRGAEGTEVTIRIRQPKSTEPRVITIVRGVLPSTTVKGLDDGAAGGTDLLVPGADRIGYLQLVQILGSTPHELRVLSRRLEDEGARALILDLRRTGQVDLHSTVLVADCLLEGGTIGRVRQSDRVETFRAEPGSLFGTWPITVLVSHETPATARWLAASLQDNRRARVVGPTPGRRGSRPVGLMGRPDGVTVRSVVPVGDGASSIELVTGTLERGDGRSLAGDGREGDGSLAPDIVVAGTGAKKDGTPKSDAPAPDDGALNAAVRSLRAGGPQPD